MKKILTVLFALIVSVFIFTSCEKMPECKRYHYGIITIENQTGIPMYFALDDYSEFNLYDYDSKTYYEEFEGLHYFYFYDEYYEEWFYETDNLSHCEHLTFTWRMGEKKSTNRTLILKIYNGEELVNTIYDFKIDKKRDKPTN